ncbi:B-cell differentiation antigen CD72 [Tiliqua scincoides]|uniref:B-cell differentiation antigen CD72 n=1 Tax=Tiliqua scincoides TaxID=71010 RepID=UPI0034636BFA
MSQGVTYADLRFAKTPLEDSRPSQIQQEEMSEEDLAYENVQVDKPQEDQAPPNPSGSSEWNHQVWSATWILLGSSLFLLATAIGLGVRYWQVFQQLQQASQDHAVESGALAQRLGAKEGSLAHCQQLLQEGRMELSSTRSALRESWEAENRTQRRLALELAQANTSLARLQQQWEEAERRLVQATSCQEIGCCPKGWRLFRWKCFWISTDQHSWDSSSKQCKEQESQLATLKYWTAEELHSALVLRGAVQNYLDSNTYWIGLKKESVSGRHLKWFWADGSHAERLSHFLSRVTATSQNTRKYCGMMSQGALELSYCSAQHRYICEAAAAPSPHQ